MDDSNRGMVEAWNGVLYAKFLRFKHVLVDGLSQHSDAAFERCSYKQGERVLDIGCGFGDSTISIAKRLGASGAAVGVDCAENFIGAAEGEADKEGVSNASFFVGDAQVSELRGPYDHAFARLGTMFFAKPAAAMVNIRRALKPGGNFTQIVWRRREENPWLHKAEQCVKKIVPVTPAGGASGGPGPFSMAEPDAVSTMLLGAGFERVSFERFDCEICIGRDMNDAIEFALAFGPSGEAMRLAGAEGERLKPQVIAALKESLAPFVRADGLSAPSSTWFISATNPR
jgi:ubiquinone/menaquinone biosynthesis C-methylase UbiE